MKTIVKTLGALGLVGCAAMNSAFAATDDPFWYIGGNIGQSRAKIDNARILANLQGLGIPSSISDDNNGNAYKLFGGYQFNKNFALEGGYFNLGQFGYTTTTLPPALAGTLNGRIKLQGLNIDAVGMLPFTEKFSAFGRIGAQYAQAKDNFSGTGSSAIAVLANANPSKNAFNPKVGLGLQYDFTRSVGMRVEAERFRINDAIGNTGDINMYSLGLVYRFDQHKPAPVEKVMMQEPTVVIVNSPPPPPVVVVVTKVVFSADSGTDALFGFGKTQIKPTGKRALDKFAADLKGAKYDVINITGHADRIGSKEANMKLSARRAEAVKAYLVESAGIPASKIAARGVGESESLTKPSECVGKKATKKLVACLAPDRRVEVEVTGTRPAK